MAEHGAVTRNVRWRRIAPPIVGLAVLVLIIAWLAGSFEKKIAPGRDEVERRLAPGTALDITHEVTKPTIDEVIGTLKAANRTLVSSRVLATIESIEVAAGEQVRRGDVLVRLDDRELRARLDQAQQSVASARAVGVESKRAYSRSKPLFDKNVLSRSELDRAESAFRVAQAKQLQAEQAVREAEVMLSYATVAAPKSGRIVDRLAEPGDVARPGVPLLVLYDAASLRLEAPVPERLAVRMKPGDRLTVYVDATDTEIEATIDEIVPQADTPSRSFLVKVSLPRSESLYEGMFGRLRIPAGERRHLCIDERAVHRVGQLEFVDVVRDDDTLERRYVKIGRAGDDGRVEVLGGLAAGERVVVGKATDETAG